MYKQEPAANFWFLDLLRNHKLLIIDLLIESSYSDVRNAFAQLIIQSITIIIEYEQHYLFEDSCIGRFLEFYIQSLLKVVKGTLRRGTEYFTVIKNILTNNQLLVKHFYQQEYFKQVYSLLQETVSEAHVYTSFKLQSLQTNNTDQPLMVICDIITKVIMSCRTQSMIEFNEDAPTYLFKGQKELDIDQFWLSRLLDTDDFKKYILAMIQFQPNLIDMIKHVCWKNSKISSQIMTLIVSQFLDFLIEWQYLEPLSQTVEALLKMDDNLLELRFQGLLCEPFKILSCVKGSSIMNAIVSNFDKDKNYGFCMIAILANLAAQINYVGEHFKKNKQQFEILLWKAREYKNINYGLYFPVMKIQKSIQQLSAIFEEPERPIIQVSDQKCNQMVQEEPEPEDTNLQVIHLIQLNENNYTQTKEDSMDNNNPSDRENPTDQLSE